MQTCMTPMQACITLMQTYIGLMQACITLMQTYITPMQTCIDPMSIDITPLQTDIGPLRKDVFPDSPHLAPHAWSSNMRRASDTPRRRSGDMQPSSERYAGPHAHHLAVPRHHGHHVLPGSRRAALPRRLRHVQDFRGGAVHGSFPPRALRHVREWAAMHGPELLANWERAREGKPLVAIPPLE